jgi:hypothetical protein
MVSSDDSYVLYDSDGFKGICCGKDCKRQPSKLLRIKYIHKAGRFCEKCATDLLEAGLVDEELHSENSTVGGT